MRSAKLTSEHLRRGAVVYVRQSTTAQVHEHRESTRRQYELRGLAEEYGFASVTVVDDDLGRSGSGHVERPGFERLLGLVVCGEVGAIVCLEGSRLARNGRDWQHLLDMCGIVGAVVIDPQGIYDPRVGNDRLLLGIKGSLAEYELSILRERMIAARDGKAERGELRFLLPPGYAWDELGRVVIDPDARVSETIRLIFRLFDELGSARQVAMRLRASGVSVPTQDRTGKLAWLPARRKKVARMLRHPMYAGAYVWGRTEAHTRVVEGRPRRTHGHPRAHGDWRVLLRDHHAGYISWEQYERNQRALAENTHCMARTRKAGRGGAALLTGLLRCSRCGRRMSVRYRTAGHRYTCRGDSDEVGGGCFSVAGARIDEAVRRQLLLALAPHAIDAASQAANDAEQAGAEIRAAVRRDLEHARYEARLAERRYEAVDPDKRLVARELETRWEAALLQVRETERRLEALEAEARQQHAADRTMLLRLAADLEAAWEAPGATNETRQRLVHLLIYEVLVDCTDTSLTLTLHWHGGRHTELTLPRRGTANAVAQDAPPGAHAVLRKMAGRWSDLSIARTLNRQRREGQDCNGPSWTAARVGVLRQQLGLPDPVADDADGPTLTLSQAAEHLGVSRRAVRNLIDEGILPASQALPGAPWGIDKAALEYERVRDAAQRARLERNRLKSHDPEAPLLPGLA